MRTHIRKAACLLLLLMLPLAVLAQPEPPVQEVLLQPDREVNDDAELMLAVQVIKQRLSAAGISGVGVRDTVDGLIRLQLDDSHAEDVSRILELAQSGALLEFRLVKPDSLNPLSLSDLEDGGFRGPLVEHAEYRFDEYSQLPLVTFSIQPEERAAFGEFTQNSIGRRVAVVLDGVILTAPVLQGPITDSGQISGFETMEDARMLAALLSGGVLPFSLDVLPGVD